MQMDPLTPRLTRYIPYPPTLRQQAALCYYGLEMLYGGAGGGGKTDWLCMAALQFADVADYSAIIFRRTFKQLAANDGILPMVMEWLANTDAQGAETLNGYPSRYDFPSGAVLSFGHLNNLGDIYDHKGPRYDFCGFDELTDYFEKMYTYLFSRIRRAKGSKIPSRMRAGTNPGGIGHDWVKMRWGIPDQPIRNMMRGPGGRVFLPAQITDNPFLDHAAYKLSLAELSPVERARMENGDWSAREDGDVFDRTWFGIVDRAPRIVRARVRRWDLAGTKPKPGQDPDWTVGCLMSTTGRGEDAHWYVEDINRFREAPVDTRRRVKQQAQIDGTGVTIVVPQDPGSAGKDVVSSYKRMLPGFTVKSERETGSKEKRAGGFATSASEGQVSLVRGEWNGPYLQELDDFPAAGTHDDQVDASSGAYEELSQKRRGFAEFYSEDAKEDAA